VLTGDVVTGSVEWPLLITLVGAAVSLIVGTSSITGVLLWKAWKELSDMRHAVNSRIEQARIVLEAKVEDLERLLDRKMGGLDERLRRVEAENMLISTLREDFRAFQINIQKQLSDIRDERRAATRGLHDRLNEIMMMPTRSSPDA
jgi:hypothetical protein